MGRLAALLAFLLALMFASAAHATCPAALTDCGTLNADNINVVTINGAVSPVYVGLNVLDYGAKGDGAADDSAAFVAAINKSNAMLGAGTPICIRIPAGIYKIVSALPMFVGAGCVIGDGPNKTWISVDPGYSGDVFSWSEAWQANAYFPNVINIPAARSGPIVQGIQISGTNLSPNTQNAFRFYDRNDAVFFRDVAVWHLNGNCLSIGRTKNTTQAYMRESQFYSLRCVDTGTATLPSVEISSANTSGVQADSTNELDFFKLSIFSSASEGLVIGDASTLGSGTRQIRVFGLRSEGNVGDAVKIGLPADTGQVDNISVFNLDAPGIASGKFGLNVDGGANASYAISVDGMNAGPGAGGAIRVDNARQVTVRNDNLAVTGSTVTYGARLGGRVRLYGNGNESTWTYSYDPLVKPGPLVSSVFPLRGLQTGYNNVGASVLVGTTSTAADARLTSDGKAANTSNCFNPLTNQMYTINISLTARNASDTNSWYSWSLPQGVLSETSAPLWSAGTPTTLAHGTTAGAGVTASADATNKCLSLSFTPPTGNAGTWNVSALLIYSVAP